MSRVTMSRALALALALAAILYTVEAYPKVRSKVRQEGAAFEPLGKERDRVLDARNWAGALIRFASSPSAPSLPPGPACPASKRQ